MASLPTLYPTGLVGGLLLPSLPVADILRLCTTSSASRSLCNESLWHTIAERDFPGVQPYPGQSWLQLVQELSPSKSLPVTYLQYSYHGTLTQKFTVGELVISKGTTLEQLGAALHNLAPELLSQINPPDGELRVAHIPFFSFPVAAIPQRALPALIPTYQHYYHLPIWLNKDNQAIFLYPMIRLPIGQSVLLSLEKNIRTGNIAFSTESAVTSDYPAHLPLGRIAAGPIIETLYPNEGAVPANTTLYDLLSFFELGGQGVY